VVFIGLVEFVASVVFGELRYLLLVYVVGVVRWCARCVFYVCCVARFLLAVFIAFDLFDLLCVSVCLLRFGHVKSSVCLLSLLSLS